MLHVWGKGEVIKGFSQGDLRDKRPLGKPKRTWDDNIKTDLQ